MQQSRTERMRDILSPAQKNNYYLTKLVRQYGPYGQALVHEFMWRIGTPTGMRSDSPEFAEHIRAYQTKYQNYRPTPNSPPANLDIDGYVNTDFRGGLFDKVMHGFLPDVRTLAQPGSSSEITSTQQNTMTHAPEAASSTTTIAPETASVTPAPEAASSEPSNAPSSIFRSDTVSNPANPSYLQNTPKTTYRKTTPAPTTPTTPTPRTNIFKQKNPFRQQPSASAKPVQQNTGYRNPNPITPAHTPRRQPTTTPAHTPRRQPTTTPAPRSTPTPTPQPAPSTPASQPSSAPRENPQQIYAQYEQKVQNCDNVEYLKTLRTEIQDNASRLGQEYTQKLQTLLQTKEAELGQKELTEKIDRAMQYDKSKMKILASNMQRKIMSDDGFQKIPKKYQSRFRVSVWNIEKTKDGYKITGRADCSKMPSKLSWIEWMMAKRIAWEDAVFLRKKVIDGICSWFPKGLQKGSPNLQTSTSPDENGVTISIINKKPTVPIATQLGI